MTNAESPQQAATLTIDQALQQAIAHHQAGQLPDAERLYRAILEVQPSHSDANHNLGVLAVQVKQPAGALRYLKAALEADQRQAQYWLSYIDALIQAGQMDAARDVLAQGRKLGLNGEAVEALAGSLEDGARLAAQPNTGHRDAFEETQPVSSPMPHRGKKKPKLKPAKQDKSARKTATQQGDGPSQLETRALVELFNTGRYAEVANLAQTMTVRFPGHAGCWRALAVALAQSGRNAEALVPMQKAAALSPGDADAHSDLGNTLLHLGRLDDAEASYRRALAIDPNFAETHYELGNTLHHLGRLEEAEASYRRALKVKPDFAAAHRDLGAILMDLARPVESEASLRRALAIKPDSAEALSNLGNVLQELGRPDEAEASYRRALEIKPDLAEAHGNLGAFLKDMARPAESESSLRRALEIKPDFVEALSNLGDVFKDLGQLDRAEASYRRALDIKPDRAETRSNLLFLLNSTCANAPSYCFTEARQYGELTRHKAKSPFAKWSCPKQPDRLRVGFVSGDLRDHPVGYFLESLVTQLNPAIVELMAFPTGHTADELTARIKPRFAAWKPLFGQTDEAAARLIHSNGVHVLIDLSGHTRHNRLPVFAWKPAPVQVSWLGYFATTGVSEIDYLLGDGHVAPSHEASHFTENIWHMPESYFCFTEPDVALDVAPLPALSTGVITFGCFNNLAKMNDAVVAVWAKILTAVPGSRLFLKTKQLHESAMRGAILQAFAKHGITPERLILEAASPRAKLLASYQRVDIALDPFPYPGGTTSIEALWMGVPVLTKCGDRFLSHVGETIAHNAGLSDWIGVDENDYIAKAVAHASDLDGLAKLRAGLRRQVLASPLFDAARFARHFEEAVWGMWSRCPEQRGK